MAHRIAFRHCLQRAFGRRGCESKRLCLFSTQLFRTLAKIDGELNVPGLKEPVEIVRDKWGVTHI